MEPFKRVTGNVAPIDRVNVDTDAIVPARFLRRIERTGWGEVLFNDWRYTANGDPNPAFVLNQPGYRRHEDPGRRAATSGRDRRASTLSGRWRSTASARSSPAASPTSSTRTASKTASSR